MSEINANNPVMNTQTTTDGRIEVNSGGGPISFDELEQVTKEEKRAKVKPKEEKTEKSKDLTSDENKAKESKETKPKEEKSEDKKEEAPKRKTHKAKYNDAEHDLDEDTVFTVKTNGKDEPWTLKDLLADKSGRTAWDKKFSEISAYDKKVKGQSLKLEETSSKIKDIFEEKDPAVRMYKMAEIAGVNPVQFREQFYNENIPMLEKWIGMSDDERKAWRAAEDAQYYKHKADTLESNQKAEQAAKALKARVDNLRASHQVSEDEFFDTHQELQKMVQSGALEAKVTPELIIETVQKGRLWSAAEAKLDELNLLQGQERGQKLFDIVEKAFKVEMTPDLFAEWIDENLGTKKAQKVVEEKTKDREEFMSGKKEVNQAKTPPPSALFFDEL